MNRRIREQLPDTITIAEDLQASRGDQPASDGGGAASTPSGRPSFVHPVRAR